MKILDLVKTFKNTVAIELDTVTTACEEHNEVEL
jgi:hypothetical protein